MTSLTQQLEDKKKGCNKIFDSIECGSIFSSEEGWKDIIRLCPICQAEIAILEQAIAEMQKQRQEIFKLFDEYYKTSLYLSVKNYEKFKKQLNQPKTEDQ